jgi:hypothetical protein
MPAAKIAKSLKRTLAATWLVVRGVELVGKIHS